MKEVLEIEVEQSCYHCGEDLDKSSITFDDHQFCCSGCKTVYELLLDNDLCTYYDLNDNAGISLKSKNFNGKYDYLLSDDVKDKIIDFKNDSIEKVTLHIPAIHCSSCVWLLENFDKITEGIFNSRLNFVKKNLSISYDPHKTHLKTIVELLSTLGYEPFISYEDSEKVNKKPKADTHLLRQIAVVGFCMGNIMLLSFPEYFNIEATHTRYQKFFLYLNLILSIPVYLYGGWDYLKGSIINIISVLKKQTEVVSIDIPIAMAITALFIRSMYETFAHQSAGYWDSLAGLIFFLLVGKFIQKKTFNFLTFERTFKSYFPLAVYVKSRDQYENISSLKKGDIILCKNGEVLPADSTILKGTARVDYSFVTGESEIIKLKKGNTMYAGGRQTGETLELLVQKEVNNSYLTQLWNDSSFLKKPKAYETKLSQGFIKYFTLITIGISAIAGAYWYFYNPSLIWPSVTAVLMVACPCALTLSMPFTMGTVMGILGKNKFFVKNQEVIQELNEIDEVVFDKTGTLTTSQNQSVNLSLVKEGLSKNEIEQVLFSICQQSSHPKSVAIYNSLKDRATKLDVSKFEEIDGQGLQGIVNDYSFKVGKGSFVNPRLRDDELVYISLNNEVVAQVAIQNDLRNGLSKVLSFMKKNFKLHLLSGDSDQSKNRFEAYFDQLTFFQKPEDKLRYIDAVQKEGSSVLMIGDGLNDAGALQKSDVGIALSEDANRFSPACDAIIEASVFHRLTDYLAFGRSSINIVKLSFLLSLVYNFIGISWAVSGTLSPVLAAIFMPLSSMSVVLFAVGLTYLKAYHSNLLNTKTWT